MCSWVRAEIKEELCGGIRKAGLSLGLEKSLAQGVKWISVCRYVWQ